MNRKRISDLTRSLFDKLSRRHLVASFIGVFGTNATLFPPVLNAKKKRRKRKKREKQQKIAFNDFGCVNVGAFCQTSEQCCSGICEGSKDKRTCRMHDQATCQAGQDGYCSGGPPLPCDTSAGYSGVCVHTTGNASYCQYTASCHACSKDADCVPFCGPQSACIVADECCPSTGTACSSVNFSGCTFQ
jgi:hypothetical protein